MSSESTQVRLYLKLFIGTLAIWIVMVLATTIVLARTPEAPAELILVICAGAIVSLLWGLAWFLMLTHEKSSAAGGTGLAATQAEGTNVPAAQGTSGGLRHSLLPFFVGTVLIWVALIVATAVTIHDTPHLIDEMLLILGGGAVWSFLVVPSILSEISSSRMTTSGPTA